MGSGVTRRQLGSSTGGREANAGKEPARSPLDAGARQADVGTWPDWLSEPTPRCLAMQSRLSPRGLPESFSPHKAVPEVGRSCL